MSGCANCLPGTRPQVIACEVPKSTIEDQCTGLDTHVAIFELMNIHWNTDESIQLLISQDEQLIHYISNIIMNQATGSNLMIVRGRDDTSYHRDDYEIANASSDRCVLPIE
jgi:hypothetical protein